MKLVRSSLLFVMSAALLGLTAPPASAAIVRENPSRSASFNGTVQAVAVHGSTIYVVGNFTRATDSSGVSVRRHVAAVDARTGQLLPWRVSTNGVVNAVVRSRGQVFIGGSFTRAGGRPVSGLARVSEGGAVDRTFRPRVSGVVHAIAATKSRVYLGGEFSAVDGQLRTRLAAVSRTGGVLQPWSPRANNTVHVMQSKDGLVYAGGLFSAIDHDTRHGYLVALRRDGQVASVLDSDISYPALDFSITPHRIYVAGGGPGGRLAVLDRSGRFLWSQTFDGDVQAVALTGGHVYVGGHWDYLCSSARVADQGGDCLDDEVRRPKLAAFTLNGARTDWAPHPDSIEGVWALDNGRDKIAVGGSFDHFREQTIRQPRFALFRPN